MSNDNQRLVLFPLDSTINQANNLVIGGCDTVKLAADFGTPLYIFDEQTLRRQCREYQSQFNRVYPGTSVVYASKAFINRAIASLLKDEGMGLDVVSGGEISIARSVDFPMEKVYFHGNNKSAEELEYALESGIGRIVVDNWHEMKMLEEIAARTGRKPEILIRLSPGVDPHTHRFIATGITDSKFGFPLQNGEEVVKAVMSLKHCRLMGIHFHLGSLLFEMEPYQEAINAILDFAVAMGKKYGFELQELNIGGGFAVQYTVENPAPPVSLYAETIAAAIKQKCKALGIPLPRLTIEPGRATVARAGVALYKVGAIKDIPGIRCYVSVDGGMADNIRPAIYGSKYEALVANKASEANQRTITISGRFCESGDILIKDIELPAVTAGDIIAIPVSGAYCLAMASNYNAFLKPPIVMVNNGKARLIRRRETFEDLTRCDIL